MYLYHYFDKKDGPFRNLSDVSSDEAKEILRLLKTERPNCKSAQRDNNYMSRRADYEKTVRELFIGMGGQPERVAPHYMCVGHCEWLYSWFEAPAFVKIPIEEFDPKTLSFTYGDMFPTFSPIVNDGKEYRKRLYMYDDILGVIDRYGMPQDTPPKPGEIGHPYYVEVQVWSDRTVMKYTDKKFWRDQNTK